MKMTLIRRKLIVLVITLAEISNTSANDYQCKVKDIPPVDIHFPNATEIVNFVTSQLVSTDFVIDVLKTELQAIKDVLKFKAAENSEDAHLDIIDLIKKYGFKVEVHEVTTADGYILTMFRIPGDGPPVFLMHGLMSSAVDWLTAGPGTSTAYYLAEKRYDVWLGNHRGNKYSTKHETISTKCAEFWDFSFHEIAVYDLPAMIDYVLNTSGESTLAYIGHSQGTTTAMVLCSELPEYNEKLNVVILFSPVAWMTHTKTPLLRILGLGMDNIYLLLGNRGFDPNSFLVKTALAIICADTVVTKLVCSNAAFLLFGYNRGQMDVNKLPVIAAHVPGGASIKQVAHISQQIQSGQFRPFDYTKEKNLEIYGKEDPPQYDVEKITAKVGLFYSDKDWFSNVTDVDLLRSKLPNVVAAYQMENYNHIDFLFDRNSKVNLFPKVLELLPKYV